MSYTFNDIFNFTPTLNWNMEDSVLCDGAPEFMGKSPEDTRMLSQWASRQLER